jgi:hypothetical protein
LLRRLRWGGRLVDPGGGWQGWRDGWLADEPLGVAGVGSREDVRAGDGDLPGAAVVDIGGGAQRDPGAAVGVVVPAEEHLAERAGVLERAGPVGEAGRYFRVLNCDSG